MKPHLLKIQLNPGNSFNVRRDVVPFFYNKLHYHAENELVFIVKGSGRQFIGDDVRYFKSGDMILVGENLPHLWRNDDQYLRKKNKTKCEAYVVHFTRDCLGGHFFDLPENKILSALLNKARQGLMIGQATKTKVAALMQEMLQSPAPQRIIILLQILVLISNSSHSRVICKHNRPFNFSPSDSEKMDTICQYIMANFDRELPLEEIAKVACLSPNSFCRYFKSRIKKPFSRFLIEIRVQHACKLLAESEMPVSEISYECGYNNFSNFNRHFKSITSRTPSQYRKKTGRHRQPGFHFGES